MKEALSRFKDTVKGEIRKALKVLRNDEDVEEMDTSDSAISPFKESVKVREWEQRSSWMVNHSKTCFAYIYSLHVLWPRSGFGDENKNNQTGILVGLLLIND